MLAEREMIEPWNFGTGSGEDTFSVFGDGFGCGGAGITGNGATSDPDVRHSIGRDDIEVHQVNRDDDVD